MQTCIPANVFCAAFLNLVYQAPSLSTWRLECWWSSLLHFASAGQLHGCPFKINLHDIPTCATSLTGDLFPIFCKGAKYQFPPCQNGFCWSPIDQGDRSFNSDSCPGNCKSGLPKTFSAERHVESIDLPH